MPQHARRFLPFAAALITATVLAVIAAIVTVLTASPVLADDWETCAKGTGDDAIVACSRAIKSGTYNGKTLALAYSNRGFEWKAKAEFAKAVSHYDEAIK